MTSRLCGEVKCRDARHTKFARGCIQPGPIVIISPHNDTPHPTCYAPYLPPSLETRRVLSVQEGMNPLGIDFVSPLGQRGLACLIGITPVKWPGAHVARWLPDGQICSLYLLSPSPGRAHHKFEYISGSLRRLRTTGSVNMPLERTSRYVSFELS